MAEPILVRCPACGTANRVPLARLESGARPRCGRCKAPLEVSLSPVTISDASFARDVERSPLPVLVDAWAPWCGPCREIAPLVDQLASELAGRVRVAKLNVDENPETASRFALRSIPTLLVLQNGREIDRIVGAVPKAEIVRRLERVLA
jgi:thioredoxin 2